MSRRRWIKFWPQDWQRDPALRACSLAARGLWMEVLCIAHESEPYGHVMLNGRAMTEAEIASIVGRPRREILPLIAELERAGVFSRTPEGVIYSRRLVRDAVLTETGREHAEKRWNQGVAPPAPNGPPDGVRSATPMRLEARSQNPEARSSNPEAREELQSHSVPSERRGEAAREYPTLEEFMEEEAASEAMRMDEFRSEAQGRQRRGSRMRRLGEIVGYTPQGGPG